MNCVALFYSSLCHTMLKAPDFYEQIHNFLYCHVDFVKFGGSDKLFQMEIMFFNRTCLFDLLDFLAPVPLTFKWHVPLIHTIYVFTSILHLGVHAIDFFSVVKECCFLYFVSSQ